MDEKELKTLLDGVAKENGKAIKDAVKVEVEAATAGLMKSDELGSKLEAMGLQNDAIKNLTDAVAKQGTELQKFLIGKNEGEEISLKEQLKAKHEEIKVAVNKNSSFKLEVNKLLVTRASVGNTTMAMRLPDVGQLAYPASVLSAAFRHAPVSPSSNGVIRYYDQSAVTRGAASVAEGAQKPESAITWIERTLLIEKIADSIPVTKEGFNDVYFIQSEIERLLTINLALKKEDLLWDGDGITPNIKGVYTSAPLFVTTPFDDSVEAANVFDLVATIAADINASGGGKYKADTVVLNPIDTLKMKLIKDSSGRYLLPPFVSPNGDITTLKVIESSQVTPNTLVVGDFRYGTIYDLENVTIEMGWINDQFIKNAFTILAEERFALLIRVVDTTAFRKVTDIAAALGALETPAVI
jgi:hypothetical protein